MHALIRTARMTGLFYLGLAITGVLGFLLIRPRLFAAGDPAATLANLVDNESLARAGVALELLIVVTQALAAIWFYRLFRTADAVRRRRHRRVRPRQRGHDPGQRGPARHGGRGRARPDRRRGSDRPASLPGQRQPVGRRRALLRPVAHPNGRAACSAQVGCRARSAGCSSSAASATCSARSSGTSLPTHRPSPTPSRIPATVGEFWIVGYLLAIGVRRRALDEAPRDARTAVPAST